RILALIGPHRIIDRRISGDASLDPPILRGADEGTAAAETEADDAERRAAALQMVEPAGFDVVDDLIVELARLRQRCLVIGRQWLPRIKVAHRRGQPGMRQSLGEA